MADPRLIWNQIKAPDLSAASAALSRANTSFSSGLDSAQNILKQYGAGVQQKNDNALAADLAGLQSEADFQKFVDNGGLNNRNISDQMRASVLAARTGILNQAGTRANTAGTLARTAIANATEGRNAANYAYGVQQRNELAGLSGALVSARNEGRANGNATNGPQASAFDNYINSTIQSESGNNPNAQNPNSSATGPAQFIDSTWQQMMAQHPELNLTADGRTDPAQARRALVAFTHDNASFLQSANIPVTEGNLYAAHFLGRGGARAVLSSPDSALVSDIMGPTVTKANPQLQGMTVGEFRQWSANKGGANTPGPSLTTARDNFRTALANSQTLSPDQIASLLGQVNGAQAAGQGSKNDALAAAIAQGKQLVAETGATILNDVLSQPNVTTPAQITQAINADPRTQNMTSSEILALQQQAQAYAATQAGTSLLNPAQSPAATVQQAVLDQNIANTNAAAEARLNSTDQNRAIRDIAQFQDNPAATLEQVLGLGTDGQSAGAIGGFIGGLVGKGGSGYDRNQLTNMINDYARRLHVEPAVVAVAMRDSFNRDPLTIAGFNANTLGNRFEFSDVKKAVQQLDQNAIRNYRESKSNNQLMSIELSALQTQAANLQRQIAKTNSPAQRQALQAQLASLSNRVAIIESNRQNLPAPASQ